MYRTRSIARKPRRSLRGRGKVLDWIKRTAPKVNAFLKRTHLLSKLGDMGVNLVPAQYRGLADSALGAVKAAGYGRRRRAARPYTGRGLNLGGGALRLAGARMY